MGFFLIKPNMVPPNTVAPDTVAPDMVAPDTVAPDMVPPNMVPPNSRFKFFGHIYKFKVRTLKEWLHHILLASNILFAIIFM